MKVDSEWMYMHISYKNDTCSNIINELTVPQDVTWFQIILQFLY
jgi:hypothetical protein